MNWKLVFALVFVAIAIIDAKGPPKDKKPPKPGPEGKPKKKIDSRTNCVGGVCVKNQGKSGKFTVKKEGKSDEDQMTNEFDGIFEVDANGTIVGKKGNLKHSFRNFASTDFEYTEMENIEMFKNGNESGVNASYFTFLVESLGAAGANLSVNMFFFRGNGSGSFCENETFSVYPGAIKFDITIASWTFCNGANCDGEVGQYVDFVMSFKKKFKGKAKQAKKKKGLKKGKKAFSLLLLGDQSLGFSSMYEIDDDKCGEMPEGYPKIDANPGGKFSVTFRFPKFAKKVFYDPSIGDAAKDEAEYSDLSEIDTPTDTPTKGPGSSAGYQVASLFATVILGAFAMLF